MIEDPLAEELLLGNFREGDIIRAEVKDGDVVFTKATPPELPPPVEEPAGVA